MLSRLNMHTHTCTHAHTHTHVCTHANICTQAHFLSQICARMWPWCMIFTLYLQVCQVVATFVAVPLMIHMKSVKLYWLPFLHKKRRNIYPWMPDSTLSHVFQVRLFTRSCNGKAACNCAVAVKSGDDVILFDRCGAQQGEADGRPIQFQMLVNGELTTGTRVIRRDDGKAYEVCAWSIALCNRSHIVYIWKIWKMQSYLCHHHRDLQEMFW